MSAIVYLQNVKDKTRLMFNCCPVQPNPSTIMLPHQGTMMDCNECAFECPITVFAGVIDDLGGTAIPNYSIQNEGSYVFSSIDILVGEEYKLLFEISADNGNVEITGVSFTGAALNTPPAVPFTITSGDTEDGSLDIDATTVGSFSVGITITTRCGSISFTLPYNVVS